MGLILPFARLTHAKQIAPRYSMFAFDAWATVEAVVKGSVDFSGALRPFSNANARRLLGAVHAMSVL